MASKWRLALRHLSIRAMVAIEMFRSSIRKAHTFGSTNYFTVSPYITTLVRQLVRVVARDSNLRPLGRGLLSCMLASSCPTQLSCHLFIRALVASVQRWCVICPVENRASGRTRAACGRVLPCACASSDPIPMLRSPAIGFSLGTIVSSRGS